jgi:hypothetical protein
VREGWTDGQVRTSFTPGLPQVYGCMTRGSRVVERPERADVARVRAEGESWRGVSDALGWSVWAARAAA